MAVSLILSVSESSVNQANNTSVVKVTLKAKSTSGSYNNTGPSGTITIDGTSYSFSHNFSANTTTTLATKSKTVTHNADGSKTITVKGYFKTGVSSGNISTSKSVTLTKINRTWTVTLNNNGATSTKTKTYNTALALGTPTRTGYIFGGWWTGSGGTGTNYDTTLPAGVNQAITLYAKWTPITYTVTFHSNDGNSNTTTQSFTYDTAQALMSNPWTRSGYRFSGWALTDDGVPTYSDGQSVSNLSSVSGGNIDLYAVWLNTYMKPSISNARAVRCDASGNEKPSGGYVKVSFDWQCAMDGSGDYNNTDISVVGSTIGTIYTDSGNTDTGGNASVIVAADITFSDMLTITLTDVHPSSTGSDKVATVTIPLAQGAPAWHSASNEKSFAFFGIADESKDGLQVNGDVEVNDIEANEVTANDFYIEIDENAPAGTIDYELMQLFTALGI